LARGLKPLTPSQLARQQQRTEATQSRLTAAQPDLSPERAQEILLAYTAITGSNPRPRPAQRLAVLHLTGISSQPLSTLRRHFSVLGINPKHVFSLSFMGPVLEIIAPESQREHILSILAIGAVKNHLNCDLLQTARGHLKRRSVRAVDPATTDIVALARHWRAKVTAGTKDGARQASIELSHVLERAVGCLNATTVPPNDGFTVVRPRHARPNPHNTQPQPLSTPSSPTATPPTSARPSTSAFSRGRMPPRGGASSFRGGNRGRAQPLPPAAHDDMDGITRSKRGREVPASDDNYSQEAREGVDHDPEDAISPQVAQCESPGSQ
jgi:hypothetical protein